MPAARVVAKARASSALSLSVRQCMFNRQWREFAQSVNARVCSKSCSPPQHAHRRVLGLRHRRPRAAVVLVAEEPDDGRGHIVWKSLGLRVFRRAWTHGDRTHDYPCPYDHHKIGTATTTLRSHAPPPPLLSHHRQNRRSPRCTRRSRWCSTAWSAIAGLAAPPCRLHAARPPVPTRCSTPLRRSAGKNVLDE